MPQGCGSSWAHCSTATTSQNVVVHKTHRGEHEMRSDGGGRMSATGLRRVLVESPTSLGAKARRRRWEMFRNAFPTIEDLRLLDLGGTVETWHRALVRPRHVTVLNLIQPGRSDDNWIA